MTLFGKPSAWAGVIDQTVPEILRLVLDTWAGMRPPAPEEREDKITGRLCVALRHNRHIRELMFLVMPQVVILEPDVGDEIGRLDIVFLPTATGVVPCEDAYFCLECKRLNALVDGRRRTYASEYVKFGMLRFVTGQYSRLVRHGGMVGYVLDGNVIGAMDNVAKNIRKRRTDLRISTPYTFLDSSCLPGDERARETRHQRVRDGSLFRIHHMFVAGAPSPNGTGQKRASGRNRRPK